MRNKAVGPALLVGVAVVVVGALVVDRWVLDDDADCRALTARVADLDGYAWTNGMTSSGSEWLSVLATGTTEADAPSRDAIAEAIAADDDGYESFRAALPDDLRPAAERLHAVALDPNSDRTTKEVERDEQTLNRHGRSACNIAS